MELPEVDTERSSSRQRFEPSRVSCYTARPLFFRKSDEKPRLRGHSGASEQPGTPAGAGREPLFQLAQASDDRANFVAVGLLYGQGYFTQSVDNDGVQHAEYRERSPRDMPVEPALGPNGQWIKVVVRIAGRDVYSRLWRAQVGRVPVYLL